ncbi:hypothetical protein AB4572_12875 [Vibrio splendidus]
MSETRKQFLGEFPSTHDSDLIACVGTNGSPNTRDYAIGFLNAGEVLLQQQYVKYPYTSRHLADHMVYPICFNIRHGIEISLKHFLCELKKLYIHRQSPFDAFSKNSHDIEEIWQDYCRLASQFDNRLAVMVQTLKPYIKPWGEIDASGQTFRYAFSNDAQKHLTEYSIIDLSKVTLNLDCLKTHLADNFDLLSLLDEEYGCNTHTKNLSRMELCLLARELPIRSDWNEGLASIKQRWILDRKLSSNEFNRACDLIQSHWEFSSEIGVEVPLLGGISAADLVWVIEQTMYFQRVIHGQPDQDSDFASIETALAFHKRKEDWLNSHTVEEIRERLFPELVANITSLYYNKHESSYCEDYRLHYEIELKKLSLKTQNGLMEAFMHVIQKQTFISGLIDGLALLKQDSIIRTIKDIEGVFTHFDEMAVEGKQSKTDNYHDWYVSLPRITETEKYYYQR